jgi:hypothetical protein
MERGGSEGWRRSGRDVQCNGEDGSIRRKGEGKIVGHQRRGRE